MAPKASSVISTASSTGLTVPITIEDRNSIVLAEIAIGTAVSTGAVAFKSLAPDGETWVPISMTPINSTTAVSTVPLSATGDQVYFSQAAGWFGKFEVEYTQVISTATSSNNTVMVTVSAVKVGS